MVRSCRWLGVVLVPLLSGCLSFSNTVTITGVEPGMKEITGIERLAVLDLTYKEDPEVGRDIANVIIAELDQTGAFAVVERTAVARILEEQKFGTTGMVDTATVTKIGKLLGVDGVVVGEVVAYKADKKVFGKEASVSVNIRLVSVESGKVIHSDAITKHSDKSESGEVKESMLMRVSQEVAERFVSKIAPHFVERKKFLLATGGEAGEANKRGMRFASNGLWDKAIEQFEAAAKIDPQSAAVHNNMAVCLEHFGELRQAVEHYDLAIDLDPDDESIQKNLASIRDTFKRHRQPAKTVLERLRQAATRPSSVPSPEADSGADSSRGVPSAAQ